MATNSNVETVNENSNNYTNTNVCANKNFNNNNNNNNYNNNNNINDNNCNMTTTTTTTTTTLVAPITNTTISTIGTTGTTTTMAKFCNNINIINSSSSNNILGINASKSIQIVRPPGIMPPTPTSSPNTHEWSQLPQPNPIPIQFHMRERFALPYLPPVPHLNNSFVRNGNLELVANFLHPSTLPSSSHNFKIRLRSRNKFRFSNYSNWKAESNGRKLRTAASTCNMELLTRILDAGADPNAADEYKRSPLHLAACRGYIPIVQELLQYGANPNVIDSLGNTPLHLAVISASSNNFNIIVRVLLQGGASVHMYDRSNQTPLDLAEAKLRMLRSRYINPTPETAQILEDMCMLTSLILRYMVKQQKELDDLSALEKRLQNLSTSDKQEDVVSQTADELLASVERLSINNK